jgi:2-methylcitrate dehydratase PrpD
MPVGDAFHHRGFHPTAICGVFGAPAAVGRLAGLSTHALANAFGIAGSMASGLLAYLTDGSDTKRIHPGWMAHAAHAAVELAAAGATGPISVLEGHKGIYHAFLGLQEVDVPTEDLGLHWETERIAFKPYPACHFMHAAIDGVAELVHRESVDPATIERITVLMPQAGVDMVLSPPEPKRRPRTPYESKFSAPFGIGALLARGTVDVTTFTDALLEDDEVLGYAAKVDHEARAYPSFPESFPAGVRMVLRDGAQHETHVHHQRGGPQNPMTAAELTAKFDANAATALAPPERAALSAAILELDRGHDLAPLRLIQHARPRPYAA